MKQFKEIFKFETASKFKQKSFIASLIIVFIICLGLTFVPMILDAMNIGGSGHGGNGTGGSESTESGSKQKIALYVKGDVNKELPELLKKRYKVLNADSVKELKRMVTSKKVEKSVLLEDPLKAKIFRKADNAFSFANAEDDISMLLKENYKYNIGFKNMGADIAKIKKIENVTPEVGIDVIGKNPLASVAFAYVGIFFLYFLILMLGGGIAMTVCREKESRTMELLVTNVSSKSLIWGKVLSGVFLGFVQCGVMVGSAGIGLLINSFISKDLNPMLNAIIDSINPIDVLVFFVLAILGTTMYYFLFAGVGSLVTKLEEINSTMTPVTMLVVIAFILPMMSISDPESNIMKVASFIPFSSPLAMFARFTMSAVSRWELGLSIAILVVTTIAISRICIKIYRLGTLNYGNKLNLLKAIKTVFEKE